MLHDSLRVMTFNLRGSYFPDGENTWKRRAALNALTIRRYAPELIGFQEFQDGNLRAYEERLTGYAYSLGPEYQNGKPHAFNAIYWDPQRLEMLDAGGFWLSTTPERFSGSWGTRQIRSANWVRLRILAGGTEFLHLNCHLDHVSETARARASELIAHHLPKLGGDAMPVVLTGDFNCDPGSEAYQTFARAEFADAHLVAGGGQENTFHRFRGEGFEPKNPERQARIDWILVRDGPRSRWSVRRCVTIRDAEPPLYPSDHYPVLAHLSLGA